VLPVVLWFHNGFMSKASPVWVIDLKEAEELTLRLCNYASHFQPSVDPKTRDLVLLLLALAIIEGSRTAKFVAEKKAAKAAKQEADQARAALGPSVSENVVGLRP